MIWITKSSEWHGQEAEIRLAFNNGLEETVLIEEIILNGQPAVLMGNAALPLQIFPRRLMSVTIRFEGREGSIVKLKIKDGFNIIEIQSEFSPLPYYICGLWISIGRSSRIDGCTHDHGLGDLGY
jgi:hypothetical protein